MKHIQIFIFLLLSGLVHAQTMQGPSGYGIQQNHIAALKFFRPPILNDTICDLVINATNGDCYGAIVILRSNNKMYRKDSASWKEVGAGGIAIDSSFRRNDSIIYRMTTGGFFGIKLNNIPQSGITNLSDSLRFRPDSNYINSVYLRKPLTTDNTFNALLVVDGQNKTYIRSTDSLPYIKAQLAILQAADMSVTGTLRHQGGFQLIEPAASVVNLIDFRKPDFSTITGRVGTFLPGVFGRDNSFGVLSPLGPAWMIAKRDSTIGLGYIDGTTVSAKLAWRGQSLIIRQGGMTVNLNGVLVDSASGVPITPTALMDIRGANAITIAASGRITASDAVNIGDLATKGQNDIAYKSKISFTKTVTASATNLINDEVTFINNPASATTITLPAAVGNTGRTLEFAVNNSAVQTITIGPYTTSAATGGCRIVSDGTNWRIISKF